MIAHFKIHLNTMLEIIKTLQRLGYIKKTLNPNKILQEVIEFNLDEEDKKRKVTHGSDSYL